MKILFNLCLIKKTFFIACFILVNSIACSSQVPGIQWQKCYGGTGLDGAYCVKQTSDGGYIIGGYSNSIDGQVTGNHGGLDCWVVKVDSIGILQWEKSYGGTSDDKIVDITTDLNGGYIMAGRTNSNNGDVSGNHGGTDGWIIKINDTGHIVWNQVMGSTGFDYFNAIINTSDSGYFVVGSAGAYNGNVPGTFGGSDVWTIKLTKTGTIDWNKVFGGPSADFGYFAINTNDNGFLITCSTYGGGIVSDYHGGSDAWLIKLNDTGGLEWNKCYGGTNDDWANGAVQKSNGDYIIGASSSSTDGQVTGNHGGVDYWVFSINDTGSLNWEKSYGGTGDDYLSSRNILYTYDSCIVLEGQTSSLTGDATSITHSIIGACDFWIVKINDTGAIIWENAFGGSNSDTSGLYVLQTFDSGYVAVGGTTSNNYDVSGNHGSEDFWLLKLYKDPLVNVSVLHANPAIKVYPTLTNGLVYIELPQKYENAVIKLTDILGKEVITNITGTGTKKSVQISNLAEGMYFLDVISNNEVNSFKLVYHP